MQDDIAAVVDLLHTYMELNTDRKGLRTGIEAILQQSDELELSDAVQFRLGLVQVALTKGVESRVCEEIESVLNTILTETHLSEYPEYMTEYL